MPRRSPAVAELPGASVVRLASGQSHDEAIAELVTRHGWGTIGRGIRPPVPGPDELDPAGGRRSSGGAVGRNRGVGRGAPGGQGPVGARHPPGGRRQALGGSRVYTPKSVSRTNRTSGGVGHRGRPPRRRLRAPRVRDHRRFRSARRPAASSARPTGGSKRLSWCCSTSAGCSTAMPSICPAPSPLASPSRRPGGGSTRCRMRRPQRLPPWPPAACRRQSMPRPAQSLAASGLDDYFIHGTGHGLGLEIHERPTIGPRGDALRCAGRPGWRSPSNPASTFRDRAACGSRTTSWSPPTGAERLTFDS